MAVAALCGGCGGSGYSSYAGMPEGEARQEAMAGMAHAVNAPDGDVFHHKVKLVRLYRGKNGLGQKAWVAMFRDRTAGGELCIRVWATHGPLAQIYNRELDTCDLEPGTLPDDDESEES